MLSRLVFFVSIMVMCYTSFFFYPRWKKAGTEATISYDVSGYYWYLPSLFIYHDLKHQSFKDSILARYHPTNDFQQGVQCANGNYVMKYSSGLAVMYLPFFVFAHLLASPLGFPPDGFSPPYQLAIQLGGFLISILGLWYLRKLLLLYFEDRVVAITLFLLVIGTNYLNYSTVDGGMSHCWLFTVYIFLLLNTHYFYRSFHLRHAIRIGLLVGLATLIRPTDVIACLIPLLWGIERISLKSFTSQAALFGKHSKALLFAFAGMLAVISVQLVYWKYVSGNWLVYTYAGQGFSFLHPHPVRYTLSYQCGWLTYTPMMGLAFVGIVPFIKHGKNKLAILTFFAVNYYIVCSWDIWWYGGRAMIQSYPVLLFPMAALIKIAIERKIWTVIFIPFALLFLYMNIWITYQYHKGGLYDGDWMTKEYFMRVVGRWSAPERTSELMDQPDLFEKTPQNQQLMYENNFGKDTGALFMSHQSGSGKTLVLNFGQKSPKYEFAYKNGTADWIRVQATFQWDSREWTSWKMPMISIRLDNNGQYVKENIFKIGRFLKDKETKNIAFDLRLPKDKYSSATISFFNGNSNHTISIDSLKVWEFRE